MGSDRLTLAGLVWFDEILKGVLCVDITLGLIDMRAGGGLILSGYRLCDNVNFLSDGRMIIDDVLIVRSRLQLINYCACVVK